MPAERRSLRSNNKSESSSSANGERKTRSSSQNSSSNKDKPAPPRATAGKTKSASTKKTASAKGASNSDMGDKSQTNGSAPLENGIERSDDVEMVDDTAGGPTSSIDTSKDRNGDEMTVVVPPTKESKLPGQGRKEAEGDIAMEGVEGETAELEVNPQVKATQGWSYTTLFYFLPNMFDPNGLKPLKIQI